MAIVFRDKGNFDKTEKLLNAGKRMFDLDDLERYGALGVQALRANTPKDSGLTASSWSYNIKRSKNSVSIEFYNTSMEEGIPIVILLQYGHATKSGGFVQGVDFINPSVKPIFDKIAQDAWKEVTGK